MMFIRGLSLQVAVQAHTYIGREKTRGLRCSPSPQHAAMHGTKGGFFMRFKTVIVINPPSPPGCVVNRDSHGGYGQLYPLGATILPPLDIPYLAGYLSEKQVPLKI